MKSDAVNSEKWPENLLSTKLPNQIVIIIFFTL